MTTFDSANIKFPCRWNGSLIVKKGTPGTHDAIRAAFVSLNLADHGIAAGNISSAGTYETWKVTCIVSDLTTLRALFHELETLPGVRMLI